MTETYHNAIIRLDRRRERPAGHLKDMRGSDDMAKWLQMIGYSDDLDKLNIIHCAGSNGKGTTCAAVDSLLRTHGESVSGFPKLVGRYSSPHVEDIRERICINGEPISERLFTERACEIERLLPHEATPELDVPRYLQFLCLLSIHVFIRAGVNVAIFETHMGGEYDATNIISRPVVTAITSICADHIEHLGPTLADIAWHKGGIFKRGSIALSAPQIPEVEATLRKRAAEKDTSLTVVDEGYLSGRYDGRSMNLSLAVAASKALLSKITPGVELLNADLALQRVSLPGRYQLIRRNGITWYLDGGHNEEGVTESVRWFRQCLSSKEQNPDDALPRIYPMLVFAHFSKRDSCILLRRIMDATMDSIHSFRHVLLTSYVEKQNQPPRPGRNVQRSFNRDEQYRQHAFLTGCGMDQVTATATIEDAIRAVIEIGSTHKDMHVLVTGSLHLVGGVHYLLRE